MDWLGTLKTIAPTVASAVLGPLGGVAVAALGNLMGVTDATQEKIAAAVQSGKLTPEMVGELKMLEMKFKNDEAERGFKFAELEFEDVASARQMAIDTKSSTPTILSYCVLTGGGAMMATVLMGWAAADTVLSGTLIGYAVSEMKQVLQYWFGSSRGSAVKTDIIATKP
jgi:hypothetical protein